MELLSRFAALTAALMLMVFVAGCGDDEDTDPIAGTADAVNTDDEGSTGSTRVDTFFEDPCIGIGSEIEAEIYTEQCLTVKQCSENRVDCPVEYEACSELDRDDLEAVGLTPGGCYCGICGPKGAKTACLKTICAPP